MRKDCSKCRSCRDMIKFGGPGIKKQKCLFRKCHSTVSTKFRVDSVLFLAISCCLRREGERETEVTMSIRFKPHPLRL